MQLISFPFSPFQVIFSPMKAALLVILFLVAACDSGTDMKTTEEEWFRMRSGMVALLRDFYHIQDERVLDAMERVPRHLFIPDRFRGEDAYGDHPCPIGFGQTVSQPFIVAYMTQVLAPRSGERVLEIGTGSGYQAAVLAELGAEVFSVEIVPELARHAREALSATGYDHVSVRCGDGYAGWPEHAPFDVIIGTCSPDQVPERLTEQLAEGGRMMLPVGDFFQRLVLLYKRDGVLHRVEDIPVRFVPMVHGDGM
jgi:protein-L-isoaspartate(D-aspartate) O-methyltransferase